MSSLDTPWALIQLRDFVHATDKIPNGYGAVQRLPHAAAAEKAYVAEQILDRVLSEWRTADVTEAKGKWTHHREWASRCIAALERQAELAEKLGDDAPTVSAGSFHQWIWGGAKSLWQSGHYREAVEGAIKKLNAETQNKVGRRDLSETKLFQEVFSTNQPQPGKSRLRRMPDDGSDTYGSVQRGAMAFAEGVFAGIRNPLAHEADQEMTQQEAMEYLAALSVLARWVDHSTLEVAP